MKVSTKGRYALEAVTDLVLHAGTQYESIRNIAERRGLSENYLEQIFLLLRKSGIVESVRGPLGGYRIAKAPELISAGSILQAVEGRMAPVQCLASDEVKDACDRGDHCVTRRVWSRMMLEMDSILDEVTIGTLVEAVCKDEQTPVLDFCI